LCIAICPSRVAGRRQQRVAARGLRLRVLFELDEFAAAEFLGEALAGRNIRVEIAQCRLCLFMQVV
jgi:hypothetical protein